MIYKGTQKKMIMLRDTGSKYFEEAYFIIRENAVRRESISETDMIKEANRIIGETVFRSAYGGEAVKGKGSSVCRLLWYTAGLLSGIGLSFIAVMLVR